MGKDSRVCECAFALSAMFAGCAAPPPETSPPTPTPGKILARLTSVKGGVQLKRNASLDWIAARPETDLRQGDFVRTVSSAAAEVSFPHGFVLRMASDSLLLIEPTPALRLGELDFRAEVKGPERQASLSGPRFRWRELPEAAEPPAGSLSVDPSGSGRVDQHRGQGEVRTDGRQRINLNPNERVTVDAQGRAGQKARLLPPPVLVAPAHQATLTYEHPARATTVLAWTPVPGAVLYHVVVADDAWCTTPLLDRSDVGGATLPLPGLGPGKYYWRVASIDARKSRGAFSDFARFSVAPSAPGPALMIESLEVQKNVLRVRGRTEVGAVVTVNGQKLDVLADGTFVEYVTLSSPGSQRVVIRAEAAQGRVTTLERMVSASGF